MENKIKILVIEDEKNILNFIARNLEMNGYRVLKALTGKEGLTSIASQNPDIVLLDLGLPDMDGYEVIRSVREWKDVPIIVVSARTGEKEIVKILDAGADDYITKPFGTSELQARIRNCLRHLNTTINGEGVPTDCYRSAGLLINFDKRRIAVEEKEIHLTPIEYKIVNYLAHNAGKVITYSALLTEIWGPYVDGDNKILRVNMANIRRKIEPNPAEPKYIFTELGVGYRMLEDGC